MPGGVRKVSALVMVALVGVLFLSGTSAHEQETYNVIVVADGPMPANITDSDFVQGNAVVFRMKDTTENASIRITIDTDQDGLFNGTSDNTSVWLVEACELTENGTLVDDSCAVSHTYAFDLNATPGTYVYRFERAINETIMSTESFNITLWKDVHEESGTPRLGDCFGIGCETDEVEEDDDKSRTDLVVLVMCGAIIGIVGLSISIMNEAKEKQLQDAEE